MSSLATTMMMLALAAADPALTHEDRHAHTLAASGLSSGLDTGACPAGASKYAQGCGQNVRPAFSTSTPGAYFSGGFSDHMVLQRAPQLAAVYGYVVGGPGCTGPKCTVAVTVAPAAAPFASQTPKYTVEASVTAVAGRNYSHWKAMLRAAPAGGNFTVSAACPLCGKGNTNATTIVDATFGDVWFCSGQSNMWLPMHMDTNRNQTYDAILNGKYSNIRMQTLPMNNQPDGGYEGYDLYVSPAPPQRQYYGGYAGGGWLLPNVGAYANESCRNGTGQQGTCPECCTPYPQPDESWMYNTVDQFSAACWHFAQHLTEAAEANNETVIPYGLVGSHWGGTMVEMWQPNVTLNAQTCKNNSGGEYAPWQNGRWDIDSGALWNGMVLHMLNTTIKGALWYQGENNVFQCHDGGSSAKATNHALGGGPVACGSVRTKTGYACMMDNLIRTWRAAWSVVPGTTPADFPFGLVSLAGGTSEGNGENMGAFRYAQTGNTGYLGANNLFVAQAYDAGDPCAGGNQCCTNKAAGQAYACMAGEAPHTGQFMGGIHPRVKKVVGTRLAKAALNVAYGRKDTAWTGPVLKSCSADWNSITLTFDEVSLAGDTIIVNQPGTMAIGLQTTAGQGVAWTPELLPILQQLGPESPMEIQLNGDPNNNTLGTWLPVALRPKCSPVDTYHPNPGQAMCSQNTTTGARLADWNNVTLNVPSNIMRNVTAIRYAWGENPCCPSVNRFVVPCPPLSCPIQSFNSTLPAVPFWATFSFNASTSTGGCHWVSTQGPP